MQVDLYTKGVLTVIAAALVALAWQGNKPSPAYAQMGGGCGSISDPCYVESGLHGMLVKVK